jgi:hypothetical protein
MATKSIYFSIEADEKEELDRTAKELGIKPSELARRRYRQGMMASTGGGLSQPLMEYLVKLSTFQYAALERIINQRPDSYEPVVSRGSELFSDAMKLLQRDAKTEGKSQQ